MNIHKTRTEGIQEEIIVKMYAHQERMEAKINTWQEGTKACLQNMEACLERKEPTPVGMANLAEHVEDFNGATHEETVWATED
jgi:hypothetical protein